MKRYLMRRTVVYSLGCAVLTGIFGTGSALADGVVSVASQTLWRKGDSGYNSYRIPAIATATNGAILAFCEGRVNSVGDAGNIDVVLRRSLDNGATWDVQQVVWSDGANTCGNPVPIIDRSTGRIVLLMTWNNGSDGETAIINKTGIDTRLVFVAYSGDNGATWTTPKEITSSVKDSSWGWYATGPGGGIQMMSGAHAGRLVAACDHTDSDGAYRSHAIYSDDGGTTWQLGGTVPDTGLNECQVAELSDGRLLINMRNYNRSVKARRIAYSADAGATWSAPAYDAMLIEPICEASLERVRWPTSTKAGIVAFLNPASETSRANLTLRLSTNDATAWTSSTCLYSGPAAYSDLSVTTNGVIAAVYECGTNSAYDEIRSAQVALSESAATTTSATLSVSSSSSSVFEDGLQVRFRADANVNGGSVSSGDSVGTWQSDEGETSLTETASGTQRPIWVSNAFVRAEGASSPAVRFNRDLGDTESYTNQWMGSSTLTRLNLLTNSTWFVVLNLLDDNSQASLFGFPEATARFGAFFLGSPNPTNTLRFHNGMIVGQFQMGRRVSYVLDSRRSLNLANVCTNGVDAVRTTSASGGNLTTDQQFRIGAMLNDVTGRPKADIAEVIVYNRALNDAERVILQNALAAKYGVSLSANDLYAGKSAAAGDFDLDVVGIGKYAASGSTPVPGSVETTASSAGFSVVALNNSLATNGEFLFAGHRSTANGWTENDTAGTTSYQRWLRTWHLQKISSDGIDARLTFDFDTAGGVSFVSGASYRLLYRSDASAAFTALDIEGVEESDAVSFDLPDAMLADGEYTLGIGAGGTAYPQAGVSDGLTMWFRADHTVSGAAATNGAPVALWYNDGSIGSSVSVSAGTVSNAPAFKADGFERAAGVYEPVVRFNWDEALGAPAADNFQRLTTGNTITDCGITDDSTWFLVFKTLTNHWDRGVFGSDNYTSRFGAFFTAYSPNRFRFQNNMLSYQTYEYSVPDQTVMLMDSRRFGPTNAAYISTRANGAVSSDAALSATNAFSYVKSHFRIGNQQFTTSTNNFIGDIAEVRVYNRALNDAERIIVQNHLAARYGKTLSANDLYTGKNAALGDYDLDVIGIGCMTVAGTAAVPGALTDSGDAAGLRLVALNGTLANDNEFVFAGHRSFSNVWTTVDADGTTCSNRWLRDWYINRASPTVVAQTPNDGVDVRLVFDRAVAGGGAASGTYRLLYRRSLGEPFAALPFAASENGTKVSFDLTDDALVNGYYTLGEGGGVAEMQTASLCAGVGRSLRAWFRADDGAWSGDASATNGASVDRWANLGLSASTLDVGTTNDAMRPLWVRNAFQRGDGTWSPALRFNRNLDNSATVSGEPNRLTSYPRTNDFDVVVDASWFLVLKPAVSQYQRGVFGAGDDNSRFGIFYLGTPNDRMRYHIFSGNWNVDVPAGSALLTEYRRGRQSSSYALSACLNGAGVSNSPGGVASPVSGEFRIGSIPISGVPNNFIGDIAEVRVYNRAVNDAERTIIQNHLSARYGVALSTNDLYAGKTAASGGGVLDVVGVGCTTNGASGLWPGRVTTSDASAELTLSALDDTLTADGEYVLAGHGVVSNQWIYSGRQTSGATYRWKREWYLDATRTDGLSLRLTFAIGSSLATWHPTADEATYRLLRRTDASSTYADTGVEPTVGEASLSFDVSGVNLSDGLYTVGALLKPHGTMVLLR